MISIKFIKEDKSYKCESDFLDLNSLSEIEKFKEAIFLEKKSIGKKLY